jgi:plastocyanin
MLPIEDYMFVARKLAACVLAGLLCSPATAQDDPAGIQTVEIRLTDFAYTPATLDLQHGRPYRLRIINESKTSAHNVYAPDFFKAATVRTPDSEAARSGMVELVAGQSEDVVVVPNEPGVYRMRCTHYLHTTLGMKARIIVH